MASLTIGFSTIEKDIVRATTVDANKNPVPIPSSLKLDWNITGPAGIVSMFPSSDGSSCEFVGLKPGVTTAVCSGDNLIPATVTVTINAALAVSIVLTADAPVLQ